MFILYYYIISYVIITSSISFVPACTIAVITASAYAALFSSITLFSFFLSYCCNTINTQNKPTGETLVMFFRCVWQMPNVSNLKTKNPIMSAMCFCWFLRGWQILRSVVMDLQAWKKPLCRHSAVFFSKIAPFWNIFQRNRGILTYFSSTSHHSDVFFFNLPSF